MNKISLQGIETFRKWIDNKDKNNPIGKAANINNDLAKSIHIRFIKELKEIFEESEFERVCLINSHSLRSDYELLLTALLIRVLLMELTTNKTK